MAVRSEVVQVVDENGTFNEQLEDFVRASDVGVSGTKYQIIAITGPQSSGKSTLMNVLVSTLTRRQLHNLSVLYWNVEFALQQTFWTEI